MGRWGRTCTSLSKKKLSVFTRVHLSRYAWVNRYGPVSGVGGSMISGVSRVAA